MIVRFLVNHPAIHRVVHRLMARGAMCILEHVVWSQPTDDSAFVARLERERTS